MRNMKKILSALAALGFITVAGASTVACGPDSTPAKGDMTNKVLEELGLYNAEGKSLIEVTLKSDLSGWTTALEKLDASKLLNDENKVKSEDSFNFLTNTLKLKSSGTGTWNQKTFVKTNAQKIKITIISISPTLKAIENDFAVNGGTVTIQWANGATKLGSEYKVNLKVAESKGIVASVLPLQDDLTLANFDTNKAPLNGFIVDQPKDTIKANADITTLLDIGSGAGKEIKTLATLVKQDLKVIITTNNAEGEKFAEGDTLTFKVSFGSVEFNTEYTLTVPKAK